MAQSARENPGVYRTHPKKFSLRLSDEQLLRVEAAAKGKAKSVSDFLRDAAMASVLSCEEAERARKQAADEAKERSFVPRGSSSASVPRSTRSPGSGFTFLPDEPVAAPPAVEPSPTVIIQQAAVPPSTPSRDEIDVLADYVLGAKNTIDRQERERVATKVIISSATSSDEQKRLAKALDDKIAARAPKAEAKSAVRTGWEFLRGASK